MADVSTSSRGYNARNFQIIYVSIVSVKDFYKFSSLLSVRLHGVVLHHFNNKFDLENMYCTLLLFLRKPKIDMSCNMWYGSQLQTFRGTLCLVENEGYALTQGVGKFVTK